eukprot:TRINITY_DN8350_c0_g1_i1.p1 TRINITY_DN8350_c0_g1~~TRINITY_DN8350_c0_g1_i1.p1  ORF type:complete len:240 (-),score=45.41 TRINITY_DN8350_c0_g1_i1:764-1408(-)
MKQRIHHKMENVGEMEEEKEKRNEKERDEKIMKIYEFYLNHNLGKAKELVMELVKERNEIGLGFCYKQGWGYDKDCDKSFESFRRYIQSNQNKEDKIQIISNCYIMLNDLSDDLNKDMKYLMKSAEMGNIHAMRYLGSYYCTKFFSDNEEDSYRNFVDYYEKASMLGCVKSTIEMFGIFKNTINSAITAFFYAKRKKRTMCISFWEMLFEREKS